MIWDLLLGVGLPLWFASIYHNVIVVLTVLTVVSAILIAIVTIGWGYGEDTWILIDPDVTYKKSVVGLHILFVVCGFIICIAPSNKFVQYTCYGIAGYNATTTLAATPLGQRTIQVVSNGSGKVVDATGKVFDSSVNNLTGMSGLLNVWIEKKTKEFKSEVDNDVKNVAHITPMDSLELQLKNTQEKIQRMQAERDSISRFFKR